MARTKDMFANIASAQAAVAVGTQTYTEVLTGISLGSGKGILIDKIEYTLAGATWNDMQTDGDYLQIGWTTRDDISNIMVNEKGVIHCAQIQYSAIGAPASGVYHLDPQQFEFTPPIIVAAPRIYLGNNSSGVDGGSVQSRIYFRYVDLSAQEYLEIAESFVLVG